MEPKLTKEHFMATIVLSIVTLGIWFFVWYWRNQKAFEKLNVKKISKGLLIFLLILIVINISLNLLQLVNYYTYEPPKEADSSISKFVYQIEKHHALHKYDGILVFVQVIILIFNIAIAFDFKQALEKHSKTKLSSALTFLFTIFYLQYKINTLKNSS